MNAPELRDRVKAGIYLYLYLWRIMKRIPEVSWSTDIKN